MKYILFACAGILLATFTAARAADESSKVIDLKKPVSASLTPDGFYWNFDDGIIGESDPRTVLDLSGNGFEGQISRGLAQMTPTYAEGVFGTAIYVQGYPIVQWAKKHKLNAAPDPTKLVMKGQPFTGGVWFKMDDRKPVAHVLIRRDENNIGWRLMVLRDTAEDKESEGAAWYLNLGLGDSRDRSKSQAFTPAFADGQWHHIGFSVSPGPGEGEFTTVYWLDGEIFDTVSFAATIPEFDPETQFLLVGNGVWGLLDDAFVTTGVHTFKK